MCSSSASQQPLNRSRFPPAVGGDGGSPFGSMCFRVGRLAFVQAATLEQSQHAGSARRYLGCSEVLLDLIMNAEEREPKTSAG